MYCWSVAKKSQIGNKVESSLPKEIQLSFQKNFLKNQVTTKNLFNQCAQW